MLVVPENVLVSRLEGHPKLSVLAEELCNILAWRYVFRQMQILIR